ncbi:MCE family protein [Mycobacterium sp. E1747]|uniref:MCE family protein n=1 Tax=Mycobacterium sp. E1747 TaxID=1834128 RepID=UPI0007FC757F|nr:MCE family protein [Mycobacterium sp. E1747]OBH08202.1 MCE-family protein MCE3A [Mycobacterium sp. E1747]
MPIEESDGRLDPAWWALFLVGVIAAVVTLTGLVFNGSFTSYVPVLVTSDRSGLVMDPGSKVKMRGVQVGQVNQVTGGSGPARLKLDIYPDQIKYIPANVSVRIRATTVFGSKYIELLYPDHPSPQRLAAGQVLQSQNVNTEVNTVFQDLVGVLHQIDPAKLNSVLSALAEGVRGEGPAIGEATTAANQVLLAINPRSETIRADWRALRGLSNAYNAAAPDILRTLDAASTTSATITANASELDALLLSVMGLSNSGISVLAPNQANLIKSVNLLRPTTDLLLKYNPEYTCLILGAKWYLDEGGGYDILGGNGRSSILDIGFLLGDDPYRYPDNLPVVGAKGGPGGKPGCGSLPDVSKNYPVRQLITNTGWGTGVDVRPNPGIGFPGWADYLPVTRGTPKPPSIRYPGGPAPGPIPYPGAPPYGAPQYAADGTPLYPGLPPAPAPGAPRDPGPRPGTEPFVVTAPASMPPTPTPPLPQEAAPSP